MTRALDLFCCGGGASQGLRNAGFDVTGVDIAPQPHYPFPFIHLDVLVLNPAWIATFDFVWASPPCQRYTANARQKRTSQNHPDLVGPVRGMLLKTGVPFVIENVPAAPLRVDLLLCGSMFGLRLVRHRIFEIHGFAVYQPEHREHDPDYITVTGHPGGSSRRDGGRHFGSTAAWREALGIDWLPANRLREAIPPAYAELIGCAALAAVTP